MSRGCVESDLATLCIVQVADRLDRQSDPQGAERLRVSLRVLTESATGHEAQSQLEDSLRALTDIRLALGDDYDPFGASEDLATAVTRVVSERNEHLQAARDLGQEVEAYRYSNSTARTEEMKAEIARLNAELDAMAQRALMPTFEAEAATTALVAQESTPADRGGQTKEAPPVAFDEGVPKDWPGRDNPAPVRVSMAAPKDAARKPTVEDRVEAIRRLADDESKADIAAALGLKNGMVVHGLTLQDKGRINRLRQAAPHDQERVLDEIRRELGAKEAANA